jgi:hypothetical protein
MLFYKNAGEELLGTLFLYERSRRVIEERSTLVEHALDISFENERGETLMPN